MKTIYLINGPNLNLLGKRQPEIYGSQTFEEFFDQIALKYPNIEFHYFQSNHEGALIDKLHDIGFQKIGIIMNPGAYSHTSIALADAIASITAPVIEVHISNIYERESFRHISYVKTECIESIIGQGLNGYIKAIDYFLSGSI